MTRLFCFGFGYCAGALARRLASRGWAIAGTSRSADGAQRISAQGFTGYVFDGKSASAEILTALKQATHLLVSVAPEAAGDPVLTVLAGELRTAKQWRWAGYLSTIGVYGDSNGAWVDEDTPPMPRQDRSIRRLQAERAWLDLGAATGRNVQVHRLAGIYGPGRNQLVNLRDGTAQRIVKPGQVFNRIHVDDIAQVLDAGIDRGRPGRIYNLTDDEPAAPDEVLVYAAALLGRQPPNPVAFANAILSPMAATFYADNRRVRNGRLRQELGVQLLFPTYRQGLSALAGELITT